MRIIKFRGKRIDNGEWVYGMPYSFTKLVCDIPIYDKPSILMFNPEWDLEAQVNYLRYPKDFSHLKDSVWKVIPKSVGQYIGMKDVGKIEIYGGDIVRSTSPYINIGTGKETGRMAIKTFQIIYLESEARFASKNISSKYYKGKIGVFSLSQERISKYDEVIGNVIDNPELLEEKNGKK